MPERDAVRAGREAYDRRSWGETFALLSSADREQPLDAPDLERLSVAAFLIRRDAEVDAALERAHQSYAGAGDAIGAARCAFWLAFALIHRREHARASGWLARATRALDGHPADCAERGFLMLPGALQRAGAGDHDAALHLFDEAAAIGERCGNADLVALARQGAGRARLRMGDVSGGVALLDEAMLAVVAGEVSPVAAGTVYCSVIEACVEVFDIRRAQEWTDALSRWCAAQPGLVAYRGECQVRRAEIFRLQGQWPEAVAEAGEAAERLAPPPVGAALYQLGELTRLRGDFDAAEDAYRQASDAGTTPHPGLALLWLARGDADLARGAIERVLEEAAPQRARMRALPAFVEIQLAAGDLSAARRGADELAAIARAVASPFLRAASAQASGAVLLAEGEARAALGSLREAQTLWRDLGVPYEGARASVLIARACRDLGDTGSARLELDAALSTLRALGARPDVARAERALDPAPPASPVLTPRETQVLRLLATGMTNRAIAGDLSISEKTVARHISNIFTKLDLPSRAAATAYAFRHRLV